MTLPLHTHTLYIPVTFSMLPLLSLVGGRWKSGPRTLGYILSMRRRVASFMVDNRNGACNALFRCMGSAVKITCSIQEVSLQAIRIDVHKKTTTVVAG